MKVNELVQELVDKKNRWKEFLAAIPADELQQPGANGEWSAKDLIGHVTFWDRFEMRQLMAAVDKSSPSKEGLYGERLSSPKWRSVPGEEFQELIVESGRHMSIEEFAQEWDEIHDRFFPWLKDMPEPMLEEKVGWWLGPPEGTRPDGETRAWAFESESALGGGRPVSEWISAFSGHWREHFEQIERWLNQSRTTSIT